MFSLCPIHFLTGYCVLIGYIYRGVTMVTPSCVSASGANRGANSLAASLSHSALLWALGLHDSMHQHEQQQQGQPRSLLTTGINKTACVNGCVSNHQRQQ